MHLTDSHAHLDSYGDELPAVLTRAAPSVPPPSTGPDAFADASAADPAFAPAACPCCAGNSVV